MHKDRERLSGSGPRVAAAALLTLLLLGGVAAPATAQTEVTKPQPTVPEVFTLMGQYVRIAYNNEGFATLGYRVAQESVGEEWALLEVGLTMRSGQKNFTLKREHLSIKTPDGGTIALATQQEFAAAGYLKGLNKMAEVKRDPINYFPNETMRSCALRFFADPTRPNARVAFDQVELSPTLGCVGRLFFRVPGGIQVGQHWLIVKFAESELQVPFRILTKEEAKEFSKTWEDIKKEHEESMQP